ncbi:DUF2839 family protein [Candidatus Cyanaurora vandensis]|uniref:DUF2839 family protein n=1 Tax=Candidatus Cyanaurora vandensis TaxID=2714958 RepID=UPI00257F150E|nr:DUF2839 family protein [Candidatus Cyanaurora vandensis]
MGDRQRRKALGRDDTVTEEIVFLGLTRSQVKGLYDLVIRSTWVCIWSVVAIWVVVRFGNWQGWWGQPL